MQVIPKSNSPRQLLMGQLRWFIRLRWVAGGTVVLLAILDTAWLDWYGRGGPILGTGLFILAYNAVMWRAATRLRTAPEAPLRDMTWAQIILDLGCLTFLTSLTGGLRSPVMGFYVFHMIFASLLLPRRMAYAVAGIAVLMVIAGLGLANAAMWSGNEFRLAVGWMAALLLSVYLANHLTCALRRQRRRLLKQNRHIRRLSRKMRWQQEALIRQEKMAALGEMAAGITHEIANPLASMDMLLQLLQRKPERVDEASLGTLRTQVARVNEIVRQMTSFAHPGGGNWETLQVNDIADASLELLHFDKRMASVKVIREYGAGASAVRVMPRAIQQVLINLIGNALDAMAAAPQPELRISTGRDGGSSFIAVADNGHGIPPENIARLFEPFFTTKPIGKGTGVGLSISYSIMQKQGGDIQAANRAGGGAVFTVRLPGTA